MEKTSRDIMVLFVCIVMQLAACKGKAEPPPPVTPVTPVTPGDDGVSRVEVGPLELEVAPQFTKILENKNGEVNLLIRLSGAEIAAMQRPPLDLSLIIDRSGSMSGEKIRSAKAAALELLGMLNSNDRVTLIVYDSDVDVVMKRRVLDSAGRDALREAVLRIHTGSSTALGPAMIQGLEILESAKRKDKELAHLLLLSDGLANQGERDPFILGERAAKGFSRGVSLSTLGVGVDYNEDLMTRVADQGGGHYHFIKDSNAIAGVLEDEFKGLLATVARGVELELALADGITFKKAFGYPARVKGNKVIINTGSLRSGQNRDILVTLTRKGTKASTMNLADVKVRFKNVVKDGQKMQGSTAIALNVTSDAAQVSTSEMVDVTVRMAEVFSAQQMEIAAQAVDKGEFNQAEKTLQESYDSLKKQAKETPDSKLDKQVDEVRQAMKDIKKAKSSKREQKSYVKAQKSKSYKSKKSGTKPSSWRKKK